MTQIIDLLLTGQDEDQTTAMLKSVSWINEEGQLQPPFKCSAMPISLWRKLPQHDEDGTQIEAEEQTPGYWMGLCIPDRSLLDELWQLSGVVAALDRASGKVLRLKGFSMADVNGLEKIQPMWAGSSYQWGQFLPFD